MIVGGVVRLSSVAARRLPAVACMRRFASGEVSAAALEGRHNGVDPIKDESLTPELELKANQRWDECVLMKKQGIII
jgi:hypothetical protein